jgi:hypothetical protein
LLWRFLCNFIDLLPDIGSVAVQAGDIDMISTDHSPSAPEMKLLEEGDFLKAWGGISSLQVGAQCKSCLDVSSLVQSFH